MLLPRDTDLEAPREHNYRLHRTTSLHYLTLLLSTARLRLLTRLPTRSLGHCGLAQVHPDSAFYLTWPQFTRFILLRPYKLHKLMHTCKSSLFQENSKNCCPISFLSLFSLLSQRDRLLYTSGCSIAVRPPTINLPSPTDVGTGSPLSLGALKFVWGRLSSAS